MARRVRPVQSPSSSTGLSQLITNALPPLCTQSWDRVNPTDAAAACFYVPNARNSFLNNAASGGWTGFSFPRLEAPVGMFRWRKDVVGSLPLT
jgi:hypothetical protein